MTSTIPKRNQQLIDLTFDEISLNTEKDLNSTCQYESQSTDHHESLDLSQYKPKWDSNPHGTILEDPQFLSNFNSEFKLWTKEKQSAEHRASLTTLLLSGSQYQRNVVKQKSCNIGSSGRPLEKRSLRNGYWHDSIPYFNKLFRTRYSPVFLSSSLSEDSMMSMKSEESSDVALLSTAKRASAVGSDHQDAMAKMKSTNPFLSDLSDQAETARLVDKTHALRQNMNHDYTNYDISDDDQSNALNGKQPSKWSLYRGIFYSSLSSVFFSLSAVIVKYLKDVHPGQLAVSRFVGIFLLTIPMIVYYDLNPFGPPALRHLLILRGVAGATSLLLRFFAFHYLPIADASVIIFSIPVFVSIFAWLFLKEPCGMFQIVTVTMAMIGLVMTTKLPLFFQPESSYLYQQNRYYYDASRLKALTENRSLAVSTGNISDVVDQSARDHFYGVASALSSLIFASAVFIFIRKAKGAHHAVIMFNFGWVAILETAVITSLMNGFSLPRNEFEWYLIVVLSVFSFCGQLLLTRSLQLEQAGPVSIVRATTDIVLAFLWQIIIFRESPDFWSVIGAMLVFGCIVLVSLRKWLMSLPDHSRLKGRFNYLLN